MTTTTAVAGAADTPDITIATMTIVGVADIAGIAIETTTVVVVRTGADTNGNGAATTEISAATAQAIRDTSGTIPTDTDIGRLFLTAA